MEKLVLVPNDNYQSLLEAKTIESTLKKTMTPLVKRERTKPYPTTHKKALRDSQRKDSLKMLKEITAGQLACIGEVAHRIYHWTYPLLA